MRPSAAPAFQNDGRGEAGRLSLFAFLACFPATAAAAQEIPPVDYPRLPAAAATEQGFVPKGWRIEARASGDLNGDRKPDSAIVLRSTDPANILREGICEERFDTNPRILAVLLADPGGGYRLAAESHELIPRRENACEVDPFSDPAQIAIEAGTLRIDLERMMTAGGWDMGNTRFDWRWRGGALRLAGFDYSNVGRNTGAMRLVSINYLTGRVKIGTGNIADDGEKVRWTRLRDRRAPTLAEVGDGLAFDPDGLLSGEQ
jgi:hypothetical protein